MLLSIVRRSCLACVRMQGVVHYHPAAVELQMIVSGPHVNNARTRHSLRHSPRSPTLILRVRLDILHMVLAYVILAVLEDSDRSIQVAKSTTGGSRSAVHWDSNGRHLLPPCTVVDHCRAWL